ncbi:tryptophan--tRNA ligase [Elysia marginata]|uniref:tryptophan--tRNA ligase n=1 Tax=Elysia marginata TaxID=1093978 RepID=A0AAV4GTG5_9GAST|nr:tryptophan--tRNA ligase [Elysia marginata]
MLTGIQSTGTPHLGNLLGAILPAIKMSEAPNLESFLFIADLHSLTQIKDSEVLRKNTYSTAATWLACGLNHQKTIFYKQSDVPQVTELAWYLSCFFPYQRLTLAHSFKDKSDRLQNINTGLFTYPMLMAADILLYDATQIPVGKDQMQHLEMTRDVATRFNNKLGDTFAIPDAIVHKETMLVMGTDGKKMSKSSNNMIDIFLPDNALRKQIMKIQTDSTPVEEPKTPDNCNVFKIYSYLASDSEVKTMRKNYLNGGYGYGQAKQELFELICRSFEKEREQYSYYMNNFAQIDSILKGGAEKAKAVADPMLCKVRGKLALKIN